MIKRCLLTLFCLCLLGGSGAVAGAAQITDAAGQVVTFDAPFSRIISLYSAHTDNLLAMGAGDVLIGASKSDGAEDLPRFSYHDGTERFLAARPDLVLIRPMIERGYGRLVASLKARGITVISLQPGTVDEMMDYWVALGLLSGHEDEARSLVSTFENETRRIRDLTQGLAAKRTVFFEAMHGKLRTFSKGSMAAWALELAGGINVAEDAVPSKGSNIAIYGKERLLAKGPTIDIYLVQQGRMNRVTREEIKNEPGFSLIRAVREGEIHFVDEALVSRPTPALLKGARRIGQILYPTLFEPTTEGLTVHGQ
ncbi:ABC transporter substrate-binding protein [Desulfoluna spongiiphila]|uniref:Iron complex transport system substrate-binding protein n=1 Tax=Desulfoluna spongiiphila TaxID=419481 RepID=A0A1G5JDS8_9BACT|nr:ABC transporter substrate-binding protein [Desulfoluna spongiiphila]SCY85858.1 iron complex transport system substrate-binding protein [Desulfoluna spongiiphila]